MFTSGKVLVALYSDFDDIASVESDYDILALNADIVKDNLPDIKKPIMICSNDMNSDIIKSLNRPCIISYATEKNYNDIVPAVVEGGHYLVLKTPIDINLAKELNILSLELGLSFDKIIMNTDIGGLGYGYEYGYSMIEKIKLEKNDEYLNFPIISEAGIEAAKTKEAKESYEKGQMVELSAVAGVIAAGADIVVVTYPENVKILKGII